MLEDMLHTIFCVQKTLLEPELHTLQGNVPVGEFEKGILLGSTVQPLEGDREQKEMAP